MHNKLRIIWDIIKKRSINDWSHLAQVGLFLLALFGYFYTVRPVYQKALLEEQTAKLTMEFEKSKHVLSKQEELIKQSNEKLTELQQQISLGNKELAKQYTELRKHLMTDLSFYWEKCSSKSPDKLKRQVAEGKIQAEGCQITYHKNFKECLKANLNTFKNSQFFCSADKEMLTMLIEHVDDKALGIKINALQTKCEMEDAKISEEIAKLVDMKKEKKLLIDFNHVNEEHNLKTKQSLYRINHYYDEARVYDEAIEKIGDAFLEKIAQIKSAPTFLKHPSSLTLQ